MKKVWNNIILRFLGVPMLTLLLFIFDSSNPVYYVYIIAGFFVLSIILWEGNRWLSTLLDKFISWEEHLAQRIIVQFGIGLTVTGWLTYLLVIWLYRSVYDCNYEIDILFKRYFLITALISVLYNSIHSGRYFFTRWKTTLLETEQLKRENLLIEYETLKNQINPHFLFNSLNTLIGLIDIDKKLAIAYGEHFAMVYRYILEHRNVELVSLEEELDIIAKHAFLLKSRFGDNFRMEIDVTAEDRSKFIPPLTLQMLMENVIKHNIITQQHPMLLEITGTPEGNSLKICNKIQRKNHVEDSTQIGLSNIKKRYTFISDQEVTVTDDKNTFCVVIPLINKIQKV